MDKRKESRSFVLRGILGLILGSALLLVCKSPAPEALGSLCAYVGGVIVLAGNYYIIFGLLISAGGEKS